MKFRAMEFRKSGRYRIFGIECICIKTTEKGFNFLRLDDYSLLLSKHVYPADDRQRAVHNIEDYGIRLVIPDYVYYQTECIESETEEENTSFKCNNVLYTAWYHNGFYDDPPELLGICSNERLAELLIEYHEKNRDTEAEFEDEAVWYKRKWTLIESKKQIKEK